MTDEQFREDFVILRQEIKDYMTNDLIAKGERKALLQEILAQQKITNGRVNTLEVKAEFTTKKIENHIKDTGGDKKQFVTWGLSILALLIAAGSVVIPYLRGH